MNSYRLTVAAAVAATAILTWGAPVFAADGAEHRMADHPAVSAKRNAESASYDYASKFYPHPAWLYLRTATPEDSAATQRADRSGSGATVQRGG